MRCNTIAHLVAAAALSVATLPVAGHAAWVNGYSMEVLVDGRPISEYALRSTRYIEALEGREYSIRLYNPTSQRVAVALAVDGLNSIDAKHTTARQAAKWVLGPYQTIVIDGWQTSSSTARKFYFTRESSSYAKWLGDTRNVGLVTAVFFAEKRREIVPQGILDYRERRSSSEPGESGRGAAAPSPAPQSSAKCEEPSRDLAATGIGRELDHRVTSTHFELDETPAAVLNLRYEYRDQLVRLGVLPPPPPPPPIYDPTDRRERAQGFEDTGFAPDPYRQRR